QGVDGDDHVEGHLRAVLAAVLQLKRADAEKFTRRTDQRGAAPEGVGRRRIERVGKDVFPITGEFLARDDAGGDRMRPAARAGEDHPRTEFSGGGVAEGERWNVQFAEGLDQTEAGFLIVAEHRSADDAALAGREPDSLRLGDQVADGEDDAAVA